MISRWNVLKLFAICTVLTIITNFPSGFTNSSVNTAIEELQNFLNRSYAERGLSFDQTQFTLIRSATLNCWFVSQVFGSMLAPMITDRWGRKIAYIVATAVMAIAAVVQFVATIFLQPEILIAGRSLCALCSPLSDAALILYLQECSPLEMRGAFSFLGEIGYGSMCVLGMLLGLKSVFGNSLQRLLGFSIIPQLFGVVFLLFIPETPKYLMITKNDREKAMKSLEFFHGVGKENDALLDEYLCETKEEGDVKQGSIKDIFTTWHLRNAAILSCMVLILTLPFYPILQSSTFFFLKGDIPSSIAEISSTAMMVIFTASCITGTLFIDRFPRRILIFIFGALSNTFLLLFVIFSALRNYADWIKFASLGCMTIYCVTFGMVLGPISWFMGPELVPQAYRANIFCLCFAIGNILIAATNFATIPLYELIGAYTFLPFYVIPSTLSLIYLYLYLPETRNRETYAIVASMRRKRFKNIENSKITIGLDTGKV